MPMLYKEAAVAPALASLIKCFWILERDYRGPFPDHEHLWADVNGELILAFDSPYYVVQAGERSTLPKAFVIGPFTRSFDLYSDGLTTLVAARLFPWALYELSEQPMQPFVDEIRPAEELLGSGVTRLYDQLAEQTSSERIEGLQRFLLEHVGNEPSAASIVHEIGMRVLSSDGGLSVAELAAEYDMHPRRLERLFRTRTGLSPKALSRIVRFNYAKRLIERNPEISLAELAGQAGYSDQAHFTRTFGEMFGITPATFKAQVREALNLNAATGSSVAFLQDS